MNAYPDDPDDLRQPSKGDLAEDARLDALEAARRDRAVEQIKRELGFADKHILLSAVCPEPWNWLHPGHHDCEQLVENLREPVARILYNHR